MKHEDEMTEADAARGDSEYRRTTDQEVHAEKIAVATGLAAGLHGVAASLKLRPCPFCGSESVDPEGWCSTKDNVVFNHGPACDECGGSAEDIARWNTRPFEDGGSHLEMPAEVIDQAISSLQALHIELDEQNNHAVAAKVNEVMSALMEAEQDALATEE